MEGSIPSCIMSSVNQIQLENIDIINLGGGHIRRDWEGLGRSTGWLYQRIIVYIYEIFIKYVKIFFSDLNNYV